jgi:hypothetical protein
MDGKIMQEPLIGSFHSCREIAPISQLIFLVWYDFAISFITPLIGRFG